MTDLSCFLTDEAPLRLACSQSVPDALARVLTLLSPTLLGWQHSSGRADLKSSGMLLKPSTQSKSKKSRSLQLIPEEIARPGGGYLGRSIGAGLCGAKAVMRGPSRLAYSAREQAQRVSQK